MNSLPALYLLFIVLTFRIHQVQAQKKKHLCTRLAKRQLDRIHLKSITFSSSLQLIIFEGEHFYRIEDGAGGDGKYDDHIPLPPEYELELWNRTELSEAVEKIKHWFQYNTEVTHSPTSAYFFTSGKKFAENFFGHLNKMALLLSKTNEALFSIAPGLLDSKDSYPATLIYDRPRPEEEFALIVRQESDDEKFFFEGYVLHKDTWQNSSQYVLYDLTLKEGSAEIVLYLKQKDQQHLEKEQPAPAVYYLIQRTALPNEALLVKGGKGNAEEEEEDVSIKDKYSPRRSLFGGMDKQYLPVGYRHGKYTFLFDQQLGCIYRLELEQGLDLGTKSLALIRVKRTNIPYERFFRCSVERFPVPVWNSEERLQVERRWPADRCDRNVLGEEGGGGGGGGETTPSAGEEAVDWKMVGAISGGGLLLLVVFFGFFFCTYRPGGRKQQQFQHGGGERKKMHPRLKMADSSSSAASTASSNAASSNSSVASNRERRKSPWAKKMMMMIKEVGKKGRKGGGRR